MFKGVGLRARLHNARFNWFHDCLTTHIDPPFNMIELGCFDGRLISFCPMPPIRYQGFDADWEGGLSAAQHKFKSKPEWSFTKAVNADAMRHLPSNSFEVGAAMETLEHIPAELLDDYLAQLARIVDGYFLVTVPNEKGVVFLTKYLAKRFLMKSHQEYSGIELLNATLGRLEKIERDEHKGFDYSKLIEHIARYFEVESVEGIPFTNLPLSMAFTVGIIARSKSVE